MTENEITPEVTPEANPSNPEVNPNPANPEPNWKDEASKFRRLYEKEKEKNDGTPPANPLPAEQPKAASSVDDVVGIVRATRSLSDEELGALTAESTSLGVPLMKYLSSNAGKAHLAEIRRTSKSTSATPAPSNNVPMFNGKPADDVLKDPTASSADKQKAHEAKVNKVLRKGQPNQNV